MANKRNKQYLIAAIKKMLERDDLTDPQRIRLLSLLAKFVPVPKQRPAWFSSDQK